MSDKEAQVDWDDVGFLDIDECCAKIRELRAELVQARARLSAAKERTKELYDIVTDRNRKLTQAQNELEQRTISLQVLKAAFDREVETRVSAQLGLEKAHEYNAGLATEVKRQDVELAQAHEELALVRADLADKVQGLWLSPVKAEGLRRQLARAQMQAATPKEAAMWLWGFYDGNTLIAKPGYEDDIREAWDKLLIAVDSIAGDALLERLATLDAAEAALGDARQVARLWFRRAQEAEPAAAIKELSEEHDQLVDRTDDAMAQIRKYDKHLAENYIQYAVEDILERLREVELAAHVHDKACGELAQIVTPELAALLERLAIYAPAWGEWDACWDACNDDADAARDTAACIRVVLEALEANDAPR